MERYAQACRVEGEEGGAAERHGGGDGEGNEGGELLFEGGGMEDSEPKAMGQPRAPVMAYLSPLTSILNYHCETIFSY